MPQILLGRKKYEEAISQEQPLAVDCFQLQNRTLISFLEWHILMDGYRL